MAGYGAEKEPPIFKHPPDLPKAGAIVGDVFQEFRPQDRVEDPAFEAEGLDVADEEKGTGGGPGLETAAGEGDDRGGEIEADEERRAFELP
jgi:hypothetical protein